MSRAFKGKVSKAFFDFFSNVIYSTVYHGGNSMGTRRIIISIPDEDKLWLEGYSKSQKISVAEAIRQGIEQLKESKRQQTYQKLVEETKGIWKKGDGLVYQEKMRSEWD
jgi:hypothetical protein